jgi:hypothetical protein
VSTRCQNGVKTENEHKLKQNEHKQGMKKVPVLGTFFVGLGGEI